MGFRDAQSELEAMLGNLQKEIGDTSAGKPPAKETAKTEDVASLLGEVSTLFRQDAKNNTKASKKKMANTETLGSISDEKMKRLFPSMEEVAGKVGKSHVLVVDDDIRVLKMVQEILKTDYNVSVAPNGTIALKFLESHGTDLILLDYMMPEMNGREVLEKMRANPVLSGIPVFFLTGVSDRDKVKECLRLRPSGYILKPVKRDELLKRLKTILG